MFWRILAGTRPHGGHVVGQSSSTTVRASILGWSDAFMYMEAPICKCGVQYLLGKIVKRDMPVVSGCPRAGTWCVRHRICLACGTLSGWTKVQSLVDQFAKHLVCLKFWAVSLLLMRGVQLAHDDGLLTRVVCCWCTTMGCRRVQHATCADLRGVWTTDACLRSPQYHFVLLELFICCYFLLNKVLLIARNINVKFYRRHPSRSKRPEINKYRGMGPRIGLWCDNYLWHLWRFIRLR